MKYLSIQDLNLQNQRVLMRVDFNVPISATDTILDDTRIVQTIPSIEYVLTQQGKLILLSHMGRPKGKRNQHLSLAPCAKRLADLIGKPVALAPDCIGPDVKSMIDHMKPGEVLLLENLRFHRGEEHPEADSSFAKKLAELGDCYINDAFGAAHRNHSSIVLLPTYFVGKSAIGFLMEKELSSLSPLILSPKRPFHLLIGGAKINTKIGVLTALLEKIDCVYLGGGIVFTFLKAQKHTIGGSLYEEKYLSEAKEFLKKCSERMIQIYFPKDFVVTTDISSGKDSKIVPLEKIEEGWSGVDIGPKTIEYWLPNLSKASTIFWNGPMGIFEIAPFSQGTKDLAKGLSTLQSTIVVGGGDSVAAIHDLKLAKNFSHISTGGGATLEFLRYGRLPGIEVLAIR